MTNPSRRDLAKLTAGLAAGASVLATYQVYGQVSSKRVDAELELAIRSPQSFMFVEQITFKIEGDGHSRDLQISSALNTQGEPSVENVRGGSMRIFRANADLDEFTRQGGLYWQFRDTQGKVQFKKKGALIMIVRDNDDTVRCYSLEPDLRC